VDQSRVILPDGRHGNAEAESSRIGKSGRFKVYLHKIVCEDGQSLFFKKISRIESQSETTARKAHQAINREAHLVTHTMNFGTKIPVRSFENSISFYQGTLGLSVKRQSQEITVFDQGLVLIPITYCEHHLQGTQLRTLLYIEVDEIEKRFEKIKDSELSIMTPIGNWGKSSRLFFRCTDPDGNIVEVFSAER